MSRLRVVAATCIVAAAMGTASSAGDWPQWLGPNQDSVWRETGIVDAFPEGGLTVRWRVEVGLGYSGPAVVGDRIFLTDYVRKSGEVVNNPGARQELGGTERVLCLDDKDGRVVWKHEYQRPYNVSFPAGPRATPTVHDGKVYTLGAEGNLFCLNAGDGNVIWSKELQKDYDTESPFWGYSAAPIVDGDKLFCMVGGEGSVVVAFNKDTGSELWKALSASSAGYCAPSIIEAGGKRQLIVWHPEEINGLDPESGKVYWTQPLKPGYGMSIMVPRKNGDYLFASGILDVGALFKLDPGKPDASVVWRGRTRTAVYCANSTPFIDNGVIYGVGCRDGKLRGVDLLTGDRLWESVKPTTGDKPASHGTAYLVKHEDRFFLFSETGDLILARLSPKGYGEISRFHVLEPTNEWQGRPVVWAHPAFANKCVYARNDKELVCVSLAK